MNKERMRELSNFYRNQLVNDTMPFWMDHAADLEFGGFSTYLDRRGEILCTDKPMWVMGRISWVLARLYNALEPRGKWLEMARHGVEFLTRYGFDEDGRMFYLVTREGRPLRKRRYLFTETFGVMALAEYARAAGDEDCLDKAKKLMRMVLDLHGGPDAPEPKIIPETRRTRGHSMAMIQINTLQTLRAADPGGSLPPEGDYNDLIDRAIDEVFAYFAKPDRKALLETVGPGGEYLGDLPEGRCVNPGHALETAWFIMEEGKHRGQPELVRRALPLVDWSLEDGWDDEHGGLFYFVDAEGRQPAQLEWDMKLWWPHNEALYCTLLAYSLTGERKYADWFEKLHVWTHRHFPDKRYGEWIGYLHRDGSVAMDLKGNFFKGPFHLPRQQLYCHLLLEEMLGG